MPSDDAAPFWTLAPAEALARVGGRPGGLTDEEARARRARAPSRPPSRRMRDLGLLARQFGSPIVLVLVAAAALSLLLRAAVDGATILLIVAASGLLGFWQERRAADAMARLRATVQVRARVLRDGRPVEVPLDEVVAGDVVVPERGDAVPADCLLLEAADLFVDEAALTGEGFPVEKVVGASPAGAPLAARGNVLYMGSHVVAGSARAVAVAVGEATEFGRIAERLRLRAPETEFERGLRRFGNLLLEVTLLLVMLIFAVNAWFGRPVLEALLFSVALAVGLTPQLLPAVVAVNLSHGARRMAAGKVMVKRLSAIENFGAMDVLCVDKTGTLTVGTARLRGALDCAGDESERVLRHACWNAALQTGFRNPVDDAICARAGAPTGARKLDEVPYDFARKRLTVLVEAEGARRMVSKGAFANVLAACDRAELGGRVVPLAEVEPALAARFAALSDEGLRVLAVAARDVEAAHVTADDERGMTLLGLLVFEDPPKPGVADVVQRLAARGVALKILSGDNRAVTAAVGRGLGLDGAPVVAGGELRDLGDAALRRQADTAQLFAELAPSDKERIVAALRHAGHVVGFLGDGINDAPALHAADVGLSVDSAVDVAKDAADIVLLEKDLHLLLAGVEEGRRTFANTMKYVFMATSANFGNMFSMAGASLVLPFLPLLAKQVLLVNLLTDLPEMAIASDRVDEELVARPRRWDVRFIRRFMVAFGLLSSLFDFATFALLSLARAGERAWRAGWFVESVLSAVLVVLVVRTRRPAVLSRPGRALVVASLGAVAAAAILPWTAAGSALGFAPPPARFLLALPLLLAGYLAAAEGVKRLFFRRPT